MKKLTVLPLVVFIILSLSGVGSATNGNHLIGMSPVSISLGGAGIALPGDGTSAVVSNPASMTFWPGGAGGAGYSLDVGSVVGAPRTEARVTRAGVTFEAEGPDKLFPIPSAALILPRGGALPRWRAGIALAGVAGFGVDYKGSDIDRPTFYLGTFPLVKGLDAELQLAKLASSVAFKATENISFGASLHLGYAELDLGKGSSTDYSIGGQAGVLVRHGDHIRLGLTYTSPLKSTFKGVFDLDGDGVLDTLTLEMPQEVGLGVGLVLLEGDLLLRADLKWKNWADADGYDDLDWEDQWVAAIGAGYRAADRLVLRLGYNYGTNPVVEHQNFVGPSTIVVQGKSLPTYYYETLRLFGDPAFEEHHLSFGAGYEVTERLSLDLFYTRVFEGGGRQSGTDLIGVPVSIESRSGADAFGAGIRFRM